MSINMLASPARQALQLAAALEALHEISAGGTRDPYEMALCARKALDQVGAYAATHDALIARAAAAYARATGKDIPAKIAKKSVRKTTDTRIAGQGTPAAIIKPTALRRKNVKKVAIAPVQKKRCPIHG